jgi:hypothetical protein
VLVPAVALSAFLVWFNTENQRTEQEQVHQDYASTLTEVVDRKLRAGMASLETPTTTALQQGDISGLEQVARRVLAAHLSLPGG